jgi:hypothetical protein
LGGNRLDGRFPLFFSPSLEFDMLYLLLHIILSWVCAMVVHESAHAFFGRIIGGEVTSVNLLCAAPSEDKPEPRHKRPLFVLGGMRIGLYALQSSICIRLRSDVSPRASALYQLAGPLANGVLALLFFIQDDQAAMLINLFLMAGSFSDVYGAGESLFERGGIYFGEVLCSLLVVPMVLACGAIGTWWAFALLGLTVFLLLCAIALNRLEARDALRKAPAFG